MQPLLGYGDRSARTPAPEPAHGRGDRRSPLPDLLDDWSEVLAFAFSVTNGTTETQSLRELRGPYRIDEINIQQSAADGRNVRTYLSTVPNSDEPTTSLALPARVPSDMAADTTSPTPGLGSNTATSPIGIGHVVQGDVSRLSIVCENAAAAAVSIWGSVRITHLRPRLGFELRG